MWDLGAKTGKVSHPTRPQDTMGCLLSPFPWAPKPFEERGGVCYSCSYFPVQVLIIQFLNLLPPVKFNKGPSLLIFYVGVLPSFHGLEKDIVLLVLGREAASEWVGEQVVQAELWGSICKPMDTECCGCIHSREMELFSPQIQNSCKYSYAHNSYQSGWIAKFS